MQLDLFSPKPCPADVIAFPAARQRDLVARAADELMSRSKRDGQRYWNQHLSALRRERASWGLTKREIIADLDAYTQAVSRELNIRLYYRGSSDVG